MMRYIAQAAFIAP